MWGGAGAYSEGNIFRVAGINIVKTALMPGRNATSAAAIEAGTGKFTYHTVDTDTAADAAVTYGLVWHPSAVGTTKLLDLSVESEWDIRRQGTLMLGKYAMGHGVLRPESAIEFIIAAAADA